MRSQVGAELNEAIYSQADATFRGAEFQSQWDLVPLGGGMVGIENQFDIVRATFSDGTNVPRIPPMHARIGFDYKIKGFNVRPEIDLASRQTRLFPLERYTAGYGLFNVSANYTIGKSHLAHIFSVNAYNLTDKEYRNHLSFIKELAPETGRGVKFSYTIRFF